VSVLCGEQLDDVLKEIVVWNNNYMRPLVYDDFVDSNCSLSKLQIYNSPENLYFQARFIACANASTAYCFIQDDDYLVNPEIIHSLRARIASSDIFLLPPDESLSSHLLSINSPSTNITFGFSWLGYGSLILRRNAESFLELLERIGASVDEKKMADNYYSILRNRFPEIWFGHPIPLFAGGAFTVGAEGVARNRQHIAEATNYLDTIITVSANQSSGNNEFPYVSMSGPRQESEYSPCLGRSCVLESTIKSISELRGTDTYKTAGELFSREAELSALLTEDFISNYLNFPLSNAVDSNPNTSFRSAWNAAKGDTLVLDTLASAQKNNLADAEWMWLVDVDTTDTLKSSIFSFSADKMTWMESSGSVSCSTSLLQDGVEPSECRVVMHGPSLESARYFRLNLEEAKPMPWRIYETWLLSKWT